MNPPAADRFLPSPSPAAPLLLAGPTASGKSAVALALAEIVDGEIISVDSMQVYRGLDIGTAKPTPADRARVPHHLLDVVDVTEPFSAARFAELARQAVAEIQGRGKVPILCGGTGLYFRAFIEGVGAAPPADAALRAELETTPMPTLLRELAERDPVLFAAMDRQNPRRVVRAVEVLRLTGRPFSAQRSDWSATRPAPAIIALERAPADLRRRIDERVDTMFARGLVAETRALLGRGLEQNQTAMQAIGYRQVVAHLHGEASLADTIELVKVRTRQFAKRQRTWFRREPRLTWLSVAPDEAPQTTAERVLEAVRASVPA